VDDPLKPEAPSNPSRLTPVIEENIRKLLERRKREELQLSWKDRIAAKIACFTGSMSFVISHLIIYTLWIAVNLNWIPALPRFDPSLVILAMEASVEAIFLSTFILMTQNRIMQVADRRADLNLQISLLSEREITRMIQLVQKMAKTMGINEAEHPELKEFSQNVEPEKILEAIDEHQQKMDQSN
jgi:uncharacterized membrane protein